MCHAPPLRTCLLLSFLPYFLPFKRGWKREGGREEGTRLTPSVPPSLPRSPSPFPPPSSAVSSPTRRPMCMPFRALASSHPIPSHPILRPSLPSRGQARSAQKKRAEGGIAIYPFIHAGGGVYLSLGPRGEQPMIMGMRAGREERADHSLFSSFLVIWRILPMLVDCCLRVPCLGLTWPGPRQSGRTRSWCRVRAPRT